MAAVRAAEGPGQTIDRVADLLATLVAADRPLGAAALSPVEDIPPVDKSFLVGGTMQFRPNANGAVQVQYQREVRNDRGEMVPLGTLAKVTEVSGPLMITRYNMYPAAAMNGNTLPGVSSGQAISIMDELAKKELPRSMAAEWTELTYQQILAGNTAILVFPLCVLLVFLVLSSLYESWSLPLAVILIVPMVLLSAIAGVWLSGGDNNIFTQIGLFVLIGLACKNAILIVEFARDLERRGTATLEAAIEAARLRLRPILMTSFAFILGVLPLVIATGAGAEMRKTLGTAVFSGMLGVTLFGVSLFLPFARGGRLRLPGQIAESGSRGEAARLAAVGATVGFLVAITSVGSGSLLMIFLLLVVPLPFGKLVGTDLLFGLVTMALAGSLHLAMGHFSLPLFLKLALGALPGVVIGSRLTRWIPERYFSWLFTILYFSLGARLLVG